MIKTINNKKTRGRPKKVLDYKLISNLANIMCTQEEIANVLECDVRTLQRDSEFCRIYKTEKEKGKISLRRYQFQKAKDGNVSMLIWLGKQYLNQKDEVVVEEQKFEKVEELLNTIKKEASK